MRTTQGRMSRSCRGHMVGNVATSPPNASGVYGDVTNGQRAVGRTVWHGDSVSWVCRCPSKQCGTLALCPRPAKVVGASSLPHDASSRRSALADDHTPRREFSPAPRALRQRVCRHCPGATTTARPRATFSNQRRRIPRRYAPMAAIQSGTRLSSATRRATERSRCCHWACDVTHPPRSTSTTSPFSNAWACCCTIWGLWHDLIRRQHFVVANAPSA